MATARSRPGCGEFAELCSDATTLGRTNLRYAEAAPRYAVPSVLYPVDSTAAEAIDGVDVEVRDAWAVGAEQVARREAAGRLALRPDAIAAFATRCAFVESAAFTESAQEESAQGGHAPTAAALHAVACLLIDEDAHGDGRQGLLAAARTAAEALRGEHGVQGEHVGA